MYKGTVLQYLRKYIKNLQSDQLESYLLSGECTLHGIELEPVAIAEWISDLIPYTVEIEKVFCSKVEIKIPWAQIRTKPLLIGIQQMEVTVLLHDFREQEWAVKQAKAQKDQLIHARTVDIDKVMHAEKTLKLHELSWVDVVSAGMQLRVEFCRVNLRSSSPSRTVISSSEEHKCTATPRKGESEPKPSFTIDIEGLFVAPCHHQAGWSVSYVDNPDHVYEYLKEEKILRRSRLVTLKTLTVSAGDRAVVTHSPGFRMRLSSDYTCVNLAKNRKRFSIPAFPGSSTSAVWMDRVGVSCRCSCELAALYAVVQDLLAPVMVPPESLTVENRIFHYTFNESEILNASSKSVLPSPKEYLVPSSVTDGEERFDTLPPIGGKEPKFVLKKSGANELKKIFTGLARDVTLNANKVGGQGKRLISTALLGLKPVVKSSSSAAVAHNAEKSDAMHAEPEISPHSRASRLSSAAESEYFTDAVSGEDDSPRSPGNLFSSTAERTEGNMDGFALWVDGEKPQQDEEFELEAQLVVVEKLCAKSFFHVHLNELGVVSSLSLGNFLGTTISFVLRRVDVTSESLTPLSESQFSQLAAFCKLPEEFLNRAKKITKNSISPSEAVHACTAFTASSVQITVTPPASSPDPMTVLLKIASKNAGMKAVAIKWKSRNSVPTRLLGGVESLFVEASGRMQPFEGCIHGLVVSATGWGSVVDLYSQMMAFAGEFPDPSFDPEMRMRLCIRDVELVSSTGWRVAVPNGIVSRNFTKNSFSDLLAGFQTLTPIPEVHFGDTTASNEDDLEGSAVSEGLEGAFTGCVCGQESTSWSWALPNIKLSSSSSSSSFPSRIKFPSKLAGGTAGALTVSERTWRRALVDKEDHNRHMYVPEKEFSVLVESKLKLAEQDALIEQLRDKYNTVMEEVTKRNIFLKEKWAAEAVQTAKSKDSVVEILSQKVCILEKLVRELEDDKSFAETATEQVRAVSASEIAGARKELLDETQKLKFKLENAVVVQESLADLVASKDREIAQLKQQREFLLGLGVKSSASMASQANLDNS